MLTDREKIVREVLEGVARLLDEREPHLSGLVDAQALARIMRVDPTTIRAHARELGGCKIGTCLRFDPTVAIERARLKENPTASPRRTPRTADDDDTPLLPIR